MNKPTAKMCYDSETIKEKGVPYPCFNIKDCDHKRQGYTWANCICGGRCYPELMTRMCKMAFSDTNKQELTQ